MSPPEVWGPAVWTLFHTLIEQLNEDKYDTLIDSMFLMIVEICKYLPCPDCSKDATFFLAKINLQNYKTKEEFKTMLYLFHNYVNKKKNKPLYNLSDLKKYSAFNLINVIKNFLSKYHTKGNMQLLTDSFRRKLVIQNFMAWFKKHKDCFSKKIEDVSESNV
jgi:hypothetical protein